MKSILYWRIFNDVISSRLFSLTRALNEGAKCEGTSERKPEMAQYPTRQSLQRTVAAAGVLALVLAAAPVVPTLDADGDLVAT